MIAKTLDECDVRVVGSVSSRANTVGLIVESELLPDECATYPLKHVTMTLKQEGQVTSVHGVEIWRDFRNHGPIRAA